MENLAGNEKCDAHIRHELMRARIPAVDVPREDKNPDVKYSVEGRMGEFRFTRAWYYWVVSGPTPLEIAKRLHEDPIGKEDVRVTGHCGCPPPEYPWVKHYDEDGKQLFRDPDGEEQRKYKRFIEKGILDQEGFDKARWVKDEEEEAAVAVTSVVELYHIDTDAGLRLFVDAVRDLPAAQEQQLSNRDGGTVTKLKGLTEIASDCQREAMTLQENRTGKVGAIIEADRLAVRADEREKCAKVVEEIAELRQLLATAAQYPNALVARAELREAVARVLPALLDTAKLSLKVEETLAALRHGIRRGLKPTQCKFEYDRLHGACIALMSRVCKECGGDGGDIDALKKSHAEPCCERDGDGSCDRHRDEPYLKWYQIEGTENRQGVDPNTGATLAMIDYEGGEWSLCVGDWCVGEFPYLSHAERAAEQFLRNEEADRQT